MTQTTVTIYDYNPECKEKFSDEKEKIISLLVKQVIGIEHIGSTSIKGLAAKPIIDILIGVEDIEDVERFVNPLKTVEYEYVPKLEWGDRRFFRKGTWGKGTVHIHICEINSKEWKEKLLFRDYLRMHPETAQDYEYLKKSLAASYKNDRHTYTNKKEPFIQHVIEKAKTDKK